MKLLKLFFVFTIICFTSQYAYSNIIATKDPKDYANKLGNKIIELVEAKISNEEKQKKLIELFRANADTTYMANFAIGKFNRLLTKEQKTRYQNLYSDYVVYTYIPRFREYEGERQNVLTALDLGQGEFLIKTTITSVKAKNGKVSVDYKVKRAGNSFKVFDVIGEGVSLITTHRADFTAPISQKGVDFFLDRLEEKVKKQKAVKWDSIKKKK
ncbi:MAG: ABC transporter substrate-binding protein [Rickettsiales bacterium]|nr:ABC transporter substrate-binding protein [Rickettsiales bacterium]